MALTFTEIGDARANLGPSLIQQYVIAQPAAADYPTGGYPLYTSAGSATNAGQMAGLGFLYAVDVVAATGTAVLYSWQFNRTTGKLQVIGGGASAGSAGQEVAAGTDLSGGSVTLCFVGF